MAPIEIKSVLISESVDPRCRTILEENGIRVTEKQNMKKDELIAEIKASVTPLIKPCTATFCVSIFFFGFFLILSFFSAPCFFFFFHFRCPCCNLAALPSAALPCLSLFSSGFLSLTILFLFPLHPSITLSSAEDKEVKAKRITVAV